MNKSAHRPIYQGLCLCQWEWIRENAAMAHELSPPDMKDEVKREYIRAAIVVSLNTVRCGDCPFS